MKKILVLTSVIALMASISTQTAQAGLISTDRGYISVNASSETEVAPDTAEISFTVKTTDEKSMQKASDENKKISDAVLIELSKLINTENGDSVKTSSYNASPLYSYVNSKRIFDKYEVSNRVTVRTKSIDNVGKMIDNAIKAGATNVENLNFSISNYEVQCNKLLVEASQKAQKRAGEIAKSLSADIDGIRSIDTSCSANNYNSSRLYMAKNMVSDVASSMAEGSYTTISKGTVKINANVNTSFFVK